MIVILYMSVMLLMPYMPDMPSMPVMLSGTMSQTCEDEENERTCGRSCRKKMDDGSA